MTALLLLASALALAGASPSWTPDVSIRNFADYWDIDPRAGLADLCGVEVLSPDQEHAVEVLHREPTAGLMGGVNTGKSWLLGRLALLYVGCHGNTKAIFSGPKEEQTALLSWAHLQAGYRFANEKADGLNLAPMFGGKMNRSDWQPDPEPFPDWWARVYACQRGTDGSSMKGMMHAPYALACLEEINSMDKSGVDALWAGTRAPGALFWFSFNPTSQTDTAGQLWAQLPPAGQVQLSLLRFVEWQERKGLTLPGCTDRATLERDFRKFEGTPLWYTNVLGEFPPESASWVVVPKDWFDACRGEPTGITGVGIGVDTAGGRAENVIAVVENGRVRVAWANRELHQTPRLVTEVKRIAEPYGRSVPIAVDILGQGGKGVADQLRADGYNALDFVGGGREFAGVAGSDPTMDLYADRVTWAWFQLREAAQATFEGRPSIQFPADSLLRDQLARQYAATGERRYKLESKDSANSPDRGDAVAMAWAASVVQVACSRIVTAADVAPDLLTQGDSIGERF